MGCTLPETSKNPLPIALCETKPALAERKSAQVNAMPDSGRSMQEITPPAYQHVTLKSLHFSRSRFCFCRTSVWISRAAELLVLKRFKHCSMTFSSTMRLWRSSGPHATLGAVFGKSPGTNLKPAPAMLNLADPKRHVCNRTRITGCARAEQQPG